MEKKSRTGDSVFLKLPRMFLIMKTVFISLVCTLNVQANVFSQHTKFDIAMKNVTVSEVLCYLEEISKYRFVYDSDAIDRMQRVDVEMKGTKLETVLESIFVKSGFSFVIEDGVVIIREAGKKQITAGILPQSRKITGRVRDHGGNPLPGVTVVLKGTSVGVVTDVDGHFKMDLPADHETVLVFSFVGMKTQEVYYKGEKELNVVMEEDVKQMDEVVVTGIFSKSKESYTGAVSVITEKELKSFGNRNILTTLRNIDPSFNILESNEWGSNPNRLPEVQIRGAANMPDVDQLQSDTKAELNTPLIIMDGFEITLERMMDLDDSEVETITLLKDASATAIYGSRGANGVIVITTKEPEPGKLRFSYTGSLNLEVPDLSDYDVLNAREKLDLELRSGYYDNVRAEKEVALKQKYNEILQQVERGVNTYWLSKPLRVGIGHRHNIKLEGGDPSFRYSATAQYNDVAGVMKESFRNRVGAGVYLDYRIGSFQLKNMVTYTNTRSQESPYGAFSDYTGCQPYDPYKDDEGNYLENLPNWDGKNEKRPNPLYEATLSNFDKSKYEEIVNNLGINWNITTGLLWKTQFSLTRKITDTKRFLDPLSSKNTTPQTAENPSSGELNTSRGNEFYWDLSSTLSYNRSVEKHHINLLLGVNARSAKTDNISASYRGFPSGALSSPNYAEEIVSKPVSSDNSTRLIGFLGTLNYSYNDVYLLDASVRMDGSSEFGADKRFAPFWSAGTGVNIHNYGFMKGQTVIDQLKIRVSYGQTGKVNFPPYVARTTYKMFTDGWYKTGFGGTLYALGNTNLTWETTNTWDAGVELSLWKRLLYIKASYYQKKTVDLVNSVTIPSSTGFTTYMDNIGEVENKGYELEFRSEVVRRKDLFVAVFANLAHNENRILKISESLKAYNDRVKDHFANSNRFDGSNTQPFTQYVEGGSQTSIWGVPSLGIDPATGEEIFIRPDGSITNTWNTNDQVVLGDTEPKIQGTFGLNATYKNLSLYMTFMYEAGGQIYNSTLRDKVEDVNVYTSNVDKRVFSERWQEPGDKARYRKLTSGVGGSIMRTRPTSRFVEDNNVLTLNSISLGYDFDAGQKWMKTIGLSMLRFEIGANDVCRWSSVKVERGLNYPYARSFNFSLKAAF